MSFGWLPSLLSFLLNLVVIILVFRNNFWRKHLVVALFCFVQMTVVVTIVFVSSRFDRHTYAVSYWTGDLVAHLFITLVILSLIRVAVAENTGQRMLPYGLFAGMLALLAYSLYVFHDPHINHWMNPVSRNLSLGEEFLNLILWTFLLQKREFDAQLVIISAGIGVQVTGEVIGLTLRTYAPASTVWVPNLLAQSCEFLCLLILLWAFSSRKQGPVPEPS